MSLRTPEDRVVRAIRQRAGDLLDLAASLIDLDTTARDATRSGPGEERRLQDLLAVRLDGAGAAVDVWEPAGDALPRTRQLPVELDFTGYPQLVARFAGTGGGPTLMLNGHIDVVSPDPRQAWTSDPFQAEVRDGALYGRGASDMKGGLAALVFAAEMLARCGVRLRGDLLVSSVTDEESTSAGGVALLARGVRADAAIVGEPSGLGLGIACRGSLLPVITIFGQAGHAAATQPHWHHGGAVSATEKASVVLDAIQRLRENWRDHPGHHHAYLPPGRIVATTIAGGQWVVSYADSCRVGCHVSYLPSQADADGFGTLVEREVTQWIHRYTSCDPWLAAHPPAVSWSVDVPPAETATSEPVVTALLGATAALGLASAPFGADFWHDGATFSRAGIPSVAFGPGSIKAAHAVDECVAVDDLVTAATAYAVTAMRYCGVA